MGRQYRTLRIGGLALCVALVAAACSGSDDPAANGSSAPSESHDDPSTDASTPPAESASYTLDEPVHVVGLIGDPQVSPEDPNAVPDFNDGIRMAVEEINAAGGIGGHPIEFTPVPTAAFGDTVVNSLNTALEEDPTILLGPVSSTALLTIADRVAQSGVPMLHATTDPQATLSGDAGSEWIFGLRALNDEAAAIAAQYAVEELGASNIGQLYVDVSFGQSGAAAQAQAITDLGAQVSAERGFAFDVTDLTEQALAMEGADAILDWGTPNTVALSVTTLAQQGLSDIPHIGPGSVGFSTFPQAIGDDSLLDGLLGTVDCNPIDDDRPDTVAWAQEFEDTYGYPPGYGSAQLYDAVHILKSVIDAAESSAPEDIRDGLAALDHEGVCSQRYHNVENILTHETSIVQFEGGRLKTLKTYTDLD